jgi:UDP-N-acetylglucosamine--N-acetylmuramyl-(pentapeptide) pyrophosphoryl-undecaprenol N-acetylglucosamine transferase
MNGFRLLLGWCKAIALAIRERPAAVFVTGGYASVPPALAAWTLGVPTMVYLPDIEPGLAVRFIARFATLVAVTVADSVGYFPSNKVKVTGYPVRAELREVDVASAREALGLAPDVSTVLVLGGSRGCRSINEALAGGLGSLLQSAQLVHVTGQAGLTAAEKARRRLPAAARAHYHVFPYLHEEMGLALASADLAVSRAGASTLGEFPVFGLPAVLVPYPHAWRYQRVNANWLVERGAAVLLDDERLSSDLAPTIVRLLRDRPVLARMSERMAALARPDAAAELAETVCALAG